MKNRLKNLCLAMVVMAGAGRLGAQSPVITSFSQSGVLVCSNLQGGTVASVEWASSLSGPWQTNWAGLDAVTVNSNGTIAASVPMFYRVRGIAATNAPFSADGMAFILAGSYTMGNSTGDSDIHDANPTNVYVSTFHMDTNLVSYARWQSVYNYAVTNGYVFDHAGAGKAASHPVQGVSWYDAVKWCNARSRQAGLAPVYFTDAGLQQVYTNGDTDTVYVNWSTNGYRLPTEAEWEKAARGGLSGHRFPLGDTISESLANYYSYDTNTYTYDLGPAGHNVTFTTGSNPMTSPVGYYAPNGFGLYDMAGNVWEYCWDWYGTPYAGGADPRGPTSGSNRVIRGGLWNDRAPFMRCANRAACPASNASFDLGFRCVRLN